MYVRLTGQFMRLAISFGLGSRPSSRVREWEVRTSRWMSTILRAGMRMMRPCSARAFKMAQRIELQA